MVSKEGYNPHEFPRTAKMFSHAQQNHRFQSPPGTTHVLSIDFPYYVDQMAVIPVFVLCPDHERARESMQRAIGSSRGTFSRANKSDHPHDREDFIGNTPHQPIFSM